MSQMNTLDNLLNNIDLPSGKVAPGRLLVAEPFLSENYFNHAVVCMVEHGGSTGTSMGVVMNHRTEYVLGDIVSGDVNVSKLDIPVYCGGPMSLDRLYCIHTAGDIVDDATRISDGLYIGGDVATLIEMAEQGFREIRFFVGYSGWSEGQLDNELAEHVWAVTKTDNPVELLTGYGDNYWHRYVRTLGDTHRGWRYHPQNPFLN